MRIASIIYYVISIVLLIFLMSLALPFLKNLMPGLKLVYTVFPITALLLTHFTPAEIVMVFKLAGRRGKGSKKELENAYLFFKTMQQLFITLMVIGILVFVIWLLAGPQTSPPQIAHIVAIIIGAFLYPLLFILFVCLPFKSALAKKLNELNS
jgi:magnesium-transporting ATPase (P-type)